MITCKDCKFYHGDGYRCNLLKISVTPNSSKCKDFKGKKKGQRVHKRKDFEVKESQVGLVRFIDFIEDVGYYKLGFGLQIENKVYLNNGKFKYVNRGSFNVTHIYEFLPEEANDYLLELYAKYKY